MCLHPNLNIKVVQIGKVIYMEIIVCGYPAYCTTFAQNQEPDPPLPVNPFPKTRTNSEVHVDSLC